MAARAPDVPTRRSPATLTFPRPAPTALKTPPPRARPAAPTTAPSMSVQNKILRTANAPGGAPDETETAVAQALLDLEANVPDLKAELRPLQISAAREVDVRGGKKAIVVFVPVPQLKAFHKVQQRCVAPCAASRGPRRFCVCAPGGRRVALCRAWWWRRGGAVAAGRR